MSVHLSELYQTRLQGMTTPPELSRKLRRADDFIRLAVVAGFQALQTENEKISESPGSMGLILGSAFGTMQTNFEVLDTVVSGEQTSPTLFSHSVFNAAAGYMASVFNIQGCALTITDFSFPFFRALREGWLAISSGRLDRCLVLQVETYSSLLQDARGKHAFQVQEWQPGGVCWLLEKREEGTRHFHCPEIKDSRHKPLALLQCAEQVIVNGRTKHVHDPLGAAMVVSDVFQQDQNRGELDCRVQGPWGEVILQLT
ncbi:MAG: beta-ketoacyl synthase chain length factor [Desulforhopalus sp.]